MNFTYKVQGNENDLSKMQLWECYKKRFHSQQKSALSLIAVRMNIVNTFLLIEKIQTDLQMKKNQE